MAAALGGLLCGLLGQPVLLGYIAAGMIVGPGGLGLVHELVQVETLAQFGVVFLLFALGVEFSIVKMQGVQAVAIGGGTIQIIIAMVLGGMLGSTVTQGVFVGKWRRGIGSPHNHVLMFDDRLTQRLFEDWGRYVVRFF